MAGSPRTARPLARPFRDNSVSDDARRARGGAPGQRSDQQSAKESARALSTLPHAARSAAPFGAALDHLPPALGSRRSLPRRVPGNDRRAAEAAIADLKPRRAAGEGFPCFGLVPAKIRRYPAQTNFPTTLGSRSRSSRRASCAPAMTFLSSSSARPALNSTVKVPSSLIRNTVAVWA